MCVCACVAGRVRVCVRGVRWRVGVCLRAGSFTYPACNAYVPCCHCGLSGVIEISTLPHKRHDFREKFLNIKFVFLLYVQILSETFLILRRIKRDIIIKVLAFPSEVPIILVRF